MKAQKMTLAGVLICLSFTLEGSALAQETGGLGRLEEPNCYKVVGKARDIWPGTGNVSTGVLVGSRLLSGTTRYVYDTAGFPTPDPDVVTFGADFTLTTKRGVVRARVLFLFNFAAGPWTSIATIDPDASTGRFAGATGTLWFPAGATIDQDDGAQAYPSDVTGHLCLVR